MSDIKLCKYCEKNAIQYGDICGACHRKRELVQELLRAGEPFREIKRQRDERKKRGRQ